MPLPHAHTGAMTAAVGRPAYARTAARELGVDLARGVALLSMFVAHAAPPPGPWGVLVLADHLTFPLFALLVGVGAELGARARTPGAHLVVSGVRAVALLVAGWLLAQAGAQVVVVLAPLGVLTLLCWALVRLPSPVVAAVGPLGWALAPWTLTVTDEARWRWLAEQRDLRHWLLDLVASTTYPQATLVAGAAVGVLAARWLHPRTEDVVRPGRPLLATVTVAAALGSALLGLLDRGGQVTVAPYSATAASQAFALALAASVLGASELLARSCAAAAFRTLALAGAMTLTLYVLHVCWLAWRARRLAPGELDDSWTDLGVLTVGALLVALAWRSLSLPGGWRRGPLEGVLDWTTRAILPRSGRRPSGPSRWGNDPGLTGTAGQGARDA